MWPNAQIGVMGEEQEEGIVFIGPPARVIRDLGDKITARNIMIKGGVPVVPGMTEPEPGLLPKKMDGIPSLFHTVNNL